jgi:sugar/nucleoside kinase (ribokinase family)
MQSLQQIFSKKNMSILVVGSMAFDALETPFGKTDKIIGGAGTYIAYAASYFSPAIQAVSVVGGDFPKEVLADLNGRGVNTAGVEIRENEKSFFWSGKYGNDLNTRESLVTELNVLANFNPTLPATHLEPEFVMLGNLDPVVQLSVIQQLKKRPKLIVMDTMNFWMDIKLGDVLAVLKHIDVLTINDEEARQLSGEYSLVKAAQKIRAMGPSTLVIKKGEHGALLFHEDHIFFAPALPLEEVFDPTGAGDTFAGGFIGYLSKTGDTSFNNLKRAVIYGSAMASFCVEKFGTERLLNLKHAEIEKRAQKFIALVNVVLS